MSKDTKYIEDCLEKLAKGDYAFDLNADMLKKRNDAGKMSRLIKLIVDRERQNTNDLKELAEGRFDIISRKTGGKADEAVQIIAETLKGIIAKLETVIEDLSSGEGGTRLNEEKYKGGFKTIASSLNKILDSVLAPAVEIQSVIKAMSVNDFSMRVTCECSGIYKELAQNVGLLCDRFSFIMNSAVKISHGDFSDADQLRKIGQYGENDKLTPAILKMIDSLRDLTNEINYITEGCLSGNIIATRGDTEKFEGGYRDIVENINKILNTTTASLSECIEAISDISVNNFTAVSSEDVKGDFAKISSSIEAVRKHLIFTQDVARQLALGDTSKLEEYKKMGKLSEYDELTPAITDMMETIQNLIDDASGMANAADEGDLLYRIETGNVKGKYVDMLECFNKAFDMIASPIIEMSAVLEGFSVGDTHTMVTGDFSGVFEALKNDVNGIIQSNQDLVNVITKTLTEIANGNLSLEKVKEFEGDWNGAPIALNNIIESLNVLVGNIYNAVDEVAAGANQVATGSQDLAQGATEQASSIEELTASIAEIASQTKLSAQNAGKASSLAKSMRDSALSGNKEMDEMLTSMQEINDSSRSISKIIKVIDDIAFQTNILALNAAVEAARAGQHGKGFAVVADEVRNLAAKSANAANDTTSLIEGSIKRVEKGTQIAENTAKTLSTIIKGVDKVAGLVEEIAVASNEQATGITQVNQGLEQVSKVVQTNSATAEQSAAASEQLSGQAGLLKSNVEKFTLRDDNIMRSSSSNKVKIKAVGESAADKNSINLDGAFGKY